MSITLSPAAIGRVLRSLLAAELTAAGRRIDPAEAARWPDDLSLAEDALALDSLELMAAASAVNQLFQLHETGIEDYLLSERRLDQWVRIVAAGLAEGVSGLTFTTSGSTGAPRPCPQPGAVLAGEAAFWAGHFAGAGRVLQAVPAHHIYGCIFTALLADALGVPVLDIRAMAPGALARTLRPDDLLVGFPAFHATLVRALPALPGLRCVSSTGPLPAATQRALRAAGAAEVVEVYGSSETSGIALRTDPAAGFTLLPRWLPGAEGEAASVFPAAGGAEVPLPDRGRWDGRVLHLCGRKDQAVQVGGINVFPDRIAARLAAHPLVAECTVRLDTALAEPRLKAFIVPGPGIGGEQAVAALAIWCRAMLPAAERPVRIEAGPALPCGALGKPADWATAA